MKKLRISAFILFALFFCMTLTACPYTNNGSYTHFVSETRPLAVDTLNHVNKKLNITEDNFIFISDYTDTDIGISYTIINEYLIDINKYIGNDYFNMIYQSRISQGTLLLTDIDYLNKNCKLDYSLTFSIEKKDPAESTGISYIILSFKSNMDAKNYYNWEKNLMPDKNMTLNKNEIFYPDNNGSKHISAISLDKIKELLNEVISLIAEN